MNSNDFDSWNREAILRAALEYRSSSESYRSELVYTETQLARATAERDRLLEVLKELQECSAYWSEYYVPIGIHDRIQAAIASVESLQEDRDE